MTPKRLAILAVMLLSMVTAAHASRRYLVSREIRVCDSTLSLNAPAGLKAVETRFILEHPARLHTGLSPASAVLRAGDISLTVARHAAVADNIDDGATVILTLAIDSVAVATASCPDLARDTDASASYALEADSDTLRVLAGTTELRQRITLPLPEDKELGKTVAFSVKGCAGLSLMVIEEKEPSVKERLRGLDPTEVSRRLSEHKSTVDPIGTYAYLDRVNDPSVARPGGRYRLAVVPDDTRPGELLILYISGAEVETGLWQMGMLKGRLKATPFVGQYDLEWHDSHGNPLPADTGAYALHDPDTGILTLCFPLLGDARMRFVRQ